MKVMLYITCACLCITSVVAVGLIIYMIVWAISEKISDRREVNPLSRGKINKVAKCGEHVQRGLCTQKDCAICEFKVDFEDSINDIKKDLDINPKLFVSSQKRKQFFDDSGKLKFTGYQPGIINTKSSNPPKGSNAEDT